MQNYAHLKHVSPGKLFVNRSLHDLTFLRPQVFWWHRVHDWQPTKSLLENLLDVHHTSCDVGNPDRQYHPHVTRESFLLRLERGQGITSQLSLFLYFQDTEYFVNDYMIQSSFQLSVEINQAITLRFWFYHDNWCDFGLRPSIKTALIKRLFL